MLSCDSAGLGRSGGDFADSSFSAEVADLRRAAGYLTDMVMARSLLVGHSLGGAAVIRAAPDLPSVHAIATIGAPVTIAGRTFTLGQSFLDDLETASPLECITRFGGPTLILHARRTSWSASTTQRSCTGRLEDSGYDSTGATARNGGAFVTRLETRGFTLTANELASARGSETRPAPYDYLAIALVTYTATTMRVYADRKEWQVGEIGVRVEHDRVHADDCEDCEHTTGHVERLERTIHLPDGIPDTERDCSAHR